MFLKILYTRKGLWVSAVSPALVLLNLVKTFDLEDGGGKKVKKNVDYT